MKNRNLFLLTSGLAFPLLGAYAQKTPKPNIIYIMCDDMGYGDLGCYHNTEAVNCTRLFALYW